MGSQRHARVAFAVGACAGACASSPNEVPTAEVSAHIWVYVEPSEGTSGTTHVVATFGRASGDFVAIPDQELSVSTDKDANLPFQSTAVPNVPNAFLYTVDIPAADRQELTVSIARPAGLQSAPSSRVQLPPALAIVSPTRMETISYASGSLTATWSNPLPNATVFAFGLPCPGTTELQPPLDSVVPDTGSIVVTMSALTNGGPAPRSPTCVTLIVQRLVSGSADPALSTESRVTAMNEAFVDLTVTP